MHVYNIKSLISGQPVWCINLGSSNIFLCVFISLKYGLVHFVAFELKVIQWAVTRSGLREQRALAKSDVGAFVVL